MFIDDINKVLLKHSEPWMKDVQSNIRRIYHINDYLRANADTISVTVENATLTGVSSNPYFENVEKGIPPLYMYRPLRNHNVKQKLFDWSIRAGIQFTTESKRKSFAWVLRRKILMQGTELYRKGGRQDVYTNENLKLIENIKKDITFAILDYKILQ